MLKNWLKQRKDKTEHRNQELELIEKCAVYYIPCDAIRPNMMRSRCDFDEDKIIMLAYSIKRYGIIEPICVQKTDFEDSYAYEIVTGERRLRAAKMAGFTVVPCIIVNVGQAISAEFSIVENLYFEPLNYFEVAVALQRITEYRTDSMEELASRLSITQNQLSKKLMLLELDYNERQTLLSMNVSEDIAVGIARITDKDKRRAVIDSICADNTGDDKIKYIIETSKIGHSEINIKEKSEIPRDVSSVLKGVSSKLHLLNRHKKRAKMNVFYEEDTVIAEIRISL